MIEQLSELSKTIPLTQPHNHHPLHHDPAFYNIITHNCPSQLTLLSMSQQYITQSQLITHANPSPQNGVYKALTFGLIFNEDAYDKYYQLKKQCNNGSHNRKDYEPGLKIQCGITAENYRKYIKKYVNANQVEHANTNINANIEFDKIILKLFQMLRYDSCCHIDLTKNKLYIRWEEQHQKNQNQNNNSNGNNNKNRRNKQYYSQQQQYNNNYVEIQLVIASDYDYRGNYRSLHKKHVEYIRTLEYLTRVENQFSSVCVYDVKSLQELKQKENSGLVRKDSYNNNNNKSNRNAQLQQKIQFLVQQNQTIKQQLKQLRQQLKQSGDQILKNSQCVNNILRQIQGIQKYIYTHGQKLQIQQNKLMKVFDDIQEIRKQICGNKLNKAGKEGMVGIGVEKQQSLQGKGNNIGANINKDKDRHAPSFVPDHLRQKLSIDLHSNYLSKFQISGTQITYVGQDKQATQLLSSRVYGVTQKHKYLKNTLTILKTRSKCIKFGIIDRKYSKQRSCWNSPNIIYLHGWGHTMASTSEQDHKNCDYGTGNHVQMQANFQQGWIKWIIDRNQVVKLSGERQKKLLKMSQIEWVPFIAMYDYLDAVQWKIGQQ